MQKTLISATADLAAFTTTAIVVNGQLVDRYVGTPEPISVHDAINYRSQCSGALLPFLREYPTYLTPERLRCHLPYFRNARQVY